MDLFLDCKDPVRQGTNGVGANPAVDPSDANRDGSKYGSYFADRAEASAIANRRRQRVNAPSGMTLDEAMCFAVCVLRKLCAAVAGGKQSRRAAEEQETLNSAITGAGDIGDGVENARHAATGLRGAGAR